ncbi:hypothetical protein HDV00_004061 [Rhizophlyctis rosea]|nr:hypothetical protein HDV00_004061 [Rhizophlyctis rosea]
MKSEVVRDVSPFAEDDLEDSKPRRRQTQSCDRCKSKKRRCDGNNPCSNCAKAKAACTMLIEQKKRGPKKGLNAGTSGRVTKARRKSTSMTNKNVQEEEGDSTEEEDEPEFVGNDISGTAEEDALFDIMEAPFEVGHNAEEDGVFPFGLPSPVESPVETVNENIATTTYQESLTPLLLGSSLSAPTLDGSFQTGTTDVSLGDAPLITPSILKDAYFNTSDLNFEEAFGTSLQNANLNFTSNLGNAAPAAAPPNPSNMQAPTQSSPVSLPPATYANTQIAAQPTQQLNINPTAAFFNTPFLFGPIGLTIPELPNLLPDIYLHLVSLFFTHFHPTLPLIHERTFFENLVPVNNHHPMLLNAIYSIGCLFSRHPQLYQAPFYSPQKASEYFATRAANCVQPTQASSMKKGLQTTESLSTCVASLLLACCDYGARKNGRTWTFAESGCQLAQKFDLAYDSTTDDFFSLFNGAKRQEVFGTPEERKRAWWGALLVDSYANVSTGLTLRINETDYASTFLLSQPSARRDAPHLSVEYARMISGNGASQIYEEQSHDTWQPFFSSATSTSIFGAAPLHHATGVQHLLAPITDSLHLVQASFLLRRVVRFCNSRDFLVGIAGDPTLAATLPPSITIYQMHQALIGWYERLPSSFRLFSKLETAFLTLEEQVSPLVTSINEPTSAQVILVNLIFLMSLALLHQRDACATSRAAADQSPLQQHLQSFTLATAGSGTLFSSLDVVAGVYRAQCHILRGVYKGNVPPAPGSVPPPELVGSPMVSCFLSPAAVALLEHPKYAAMLVSADGGQVFGRRGSGSGSMSSWDVGVAGDMMGVKGVEPLEGLLLPVLDNLAQVWATASSYSANLRGLVEVVKSRWRKQKVASRERGE